MKLILTILGILTISTANGQVVADRYLPFNTTDAGIRHEGIKWGLDTAWDSEANVRRGIAFMGKENVDVMRVSFQPTYALIDDARLTSDQIKAVNSRIAHAKLAGTPELVINDDHLSVDEYFTKNGRANAARWANLIMITKRLYEKAGLKVVTISPFNEPDFGWGQGSMADFREICRVLKTDYADEMEGIKLAQQAMVASGTVPCTGCDYCAKVCPQGIGISGCMTALNYFINFGDPYAANYQLGFVVRFNHGKKMPSECIRCGACEAACPQNIPILECFDRIESEIAPFSRKNVLMKPAQ